MFSMVACASSATNLQDLESENASSSEEQVSDIPEPPVEENSTSTTEEEANASVEPSPVDNSEETVIEEPVVENPEESLSTTQLNSIAMLNYLATLSQEINSSKNSRLFLEEAYASLINNTNPEAVNELTESHLSSLLDIIERYRMIAVKRDRLQFMYDQGKARAIKAAVPNPVALLSAASSFDMKRLVASVVYMAVDSVSSYEAYKEDLNQQYLQDGWELDDEEAANLHESRKRAFMYMIDIVREEDLPGNLALNESNVEKFVEWKNKDSQTSNIQKIQFFEAEEKTYEAFGSYWLELADCYYIAEDYEKCLNCITRYEELQSTIFRKDYYYAEAIPKAIDAASHVYSEEDYIAFVDKYLGLLLDNTNSDEWALRYFAAEVYLSLYSKTNNQEYIQKAYDIALNNVNYLVGEQRALNKTFVDDVKEISIPEGASKEEKTQIKKYNESLKKKRETELPPVYEPLVVNCDLLFGIAEELNISQAAKDRIDGILHQSQTFLTTTLENKYSFKNNVQNNTTIELKKDEVIIPMYCLSENSHIVVTVTDGTSTVYDDWVVKKVDRKNKSFEEYSVVFSSKLIGKHPWSNNATVKVEIYEVEGEKPTLVFNFKVSKYQDFKVYKVVEFEAVN